MRNLIEDRFNTLTWLARRGRTRYRPSSCSLIRAGYSPALSRAVLEHLPEQTLAPEAVRWLMEVLERNLAPTRRQPLYEQGGIFAMVGATGVGKTTTAAVGGALAHAFTAPAAWGLITLDTYRVVRTSSCAATAACWAWWPTWRMTALPPAGPAGPAGGQEDGADRHHRRGVARPAQARTAGRAGSARGAAPAGAQRQQPWRHAGRRAHGLQDHGRAAGHPVRLDEAVKLGPALDALIRHQLELRGVTNGQRVPEDWEAADAHKLIATSMRSKVSSAFRPQSRRAEFLLLARHRDGTRPGTGPMLLDTAIHQAMA